MKKQAVPTAVVKDDLSRLDIRVALIQSLIPLGLAAVEEQLQQEVTQLAGARYARKADDQTCRRWGQQKVSVYLADQKLPIQVPRVRNVNAQTEVALATYEAFQNRASADAA